MSTTTYRAAPSAYVVFGAITAALSVLWIVAALSVDAPWEPLAVPLGGFVIVALWLSRFRLTFEGEQLVFASLFGGVRRVQIEEILSVEAAEKTGPTESPMTLCLRLVNGQELRLNAKVFPREASRRLLALSGARR